MSSPTAIDRDVMETKKNEKVVEATSLGSVDEYVGSKIRERRVALGLTQQQLANMIGVTYQQAHKYERGINRISAGRLYSIAKALNVPISFFYEGLEATDKQEVTVRQRKCLEMARNFSLIDNESQQNALSQLARTLAQN
jgi:transcriptional regulator with XRE-family HTH domain